MRALLAAGLALIASAALAAPAGAPPAVRQYLKSRPHFADLASWASYPYAEADLNGDGKAESLIYLRDPTYCGSGGCSLVVLSPEGVSYRIVAYATVTKLPVRLLESSTKGWRDLAVAVSGGGVPAHDAVLRFNGKAYPGNPSVAPRAPAKAPGRALIANSN